MEQKLLFSKWWNPSNNRYEFDDRRKKQKCPKCFKSYLMTKISISKKKCWYCRNFRDVERKRLDQWIEFYTNAVEKLGTGRDDYENNAFLESAKQIMKCKKKFIKLGVMAE